MRVTTKGQVTIPKHIRDHLGIVPGSEVEFVEEKTGAMLRKQVTGSDISSADFEAWAASVAGTVTDADLMGMDGKEYVDWLRGPYEDLDLD
jgi:AbrB family looped-hinge helix DNA binding protein